MLKHRSYKIIKKGTITRCQGNNNKQYKLNDIVRHLREMKLTLTLMLLKNIK